MYTFSSITSQLLGSKVPVTFPADKQLSSSSKTSGPQAGIPEGRIPKNSEETWCSVEKKKK